MVLPSFLTDSCKSPYLKCDRSVYLLLIELAPFHESCESGTIYHSKFHHFTNLLGGRDVFWLLSTGREGYRVMLNEDLRGLLQMSV